MSRAAATELLDTLDPFAHPRRMRHIAAHARAVGREELSGLLEGLEQHGTYGRRLAVVAACAGGDADHVAARLADPDPVVRRHAQRAAAASSSAVSDDAVLAALHDASAAVRDELLRTVVSSRRTGLADGLVDVVRGRWGDAAAARLLPGCGAETVRRLLPELLHAVTSWKTLAVRHTETLLAEAARQLDALPPVLREEWWKRHGSGVARSAPEQPHRVLELLENHRRHLPLDPQLLARLPVLAAADPGRLLRLLLAPEQIGPVSEKGLPPAVLRRLVRAEPPELIELGRAWSVHPRRFAELLRALPPGRRATFHDLVTDAEERTHEAPDEAVLEALPHSRREAEARRTAQQARERDAHWSVVLAALAHLPDDDSRHELSAATRRPSAEDRARAWPLLIRQAAFAAARDSRGDARHTAPVTAVLAEMERLREEHDPVRCSALTALADLPPKLLTDDAAEHLDRVAADAIQAPDSSAETRAALARLARSLLREHAAGGERALLGWALRTVVRLSGNTGGADLGRLDRRLRRGEEHTVHEALRYWLEAGAENADHGLTFALARAVGRRAAGMTELQELLWQAVQFGDEATARTGVELWLRDPRTRDERVAEVLALDASAALLPAVSRTITRRRTDLLGPVLDAATPYGRFLAKGSRRPQPPVGPCTDHWLPRQQRAAAELLAHEVDDEDSGMAVRREALGRLAHIPGEGARELRMWADDPVAEEAELAEEALAALVRTDRPGDALPLLLKHAGGDRSATAARVLGRACRHVAPSQLSGVLHGLLLPGTGTGTGTGGDEDEAQDVPAAAPGPEGRRAAVRVAATLLPVPDAAELLLAAYELPDQDEDVRAACVAGAARLLDDGRAWKLTESAAQGAPALRLAVLRTRPLTLPERHRERYARLITGLCDADGQEVAEAVHARLAHWAPWAPEAADVLSAAVTDLADRGTWQQAAEGLVELVVTLPGTVTTLDQVLTRLIGIDADHHSGPAEAEPARDRPARRRVEHIARALGDRARHRRDARPPAGQTGVLLAAHEEFVPSAARLLTSAVHLEADADTLSRQLRGIAGLHARRPGLAWRTADELRRSLRPVHRPGSSRERLLPVARELAEDGGHAAGLLAVALAAALNPDGGGWPEPWRAFLSEIRRHADPDVRGAALEVSMDGHAGR